LLSGENQRAEVFGNVVGIAVLNTSWLPAKKVPLRVKAEAVNPVQVYAPFRAIFHRLAADRGQRNFRGSVPDLLLFIDASLGLPAGVPVVIIAFVVQIDSQVDPVASRRNLKFAVVADIRPIVSEKHFDNVAIPQPRALFAIVGGQK